MVENSLDKFMGKYPYFLDKNKGSVFYRTSDVNNRSMQKLYGDLFRVYESGHLSKKIWVWKEQTHPYEYQIHFNAKYPLIKTVHIYKNDLLIYSKEYSKGDEKNEFAYTYSCRYLINNENLLKVYQCTKCNEIYFSDNIHEKCTCGNTTYRQLETYKCTECDEIYFSDTPITKCTRNKHLDIYRNKKDTLEKVDIYKCTECGEVYFTNENITCEKCGLNITPTYFNSFEYNLNHNDNIVMEDNRNIIQIPTITENTVFQYHFKIPSYTEPVTIHIYTKETQELIETLTLNTENNWEAYSTDLNLNQEYTIQHTPNTFELNPQKTNIYTLEEIQDMENDNNIVDIPIPVIPDDKFVIKVETYEEYVINKGFPENDEFSVDSKGKYIPNIFDHDISLDELGALNNIPRKNYNIITENELLPYTEPPFNNRKTEDDYHYMKRMLEYNTRMWSMNPVSLELWKMYGINSELVNRERYILKVFDETQHPFNEETGLVKCWTPLAWEHKDRFCDGSKEYGTYFFAVANNVNPIINEPVDVEFKLMNSLGEDLEDEFYVKAYRLTKEGNEELIVTKEGEKIYANTFRLNPQLFYNPNKLQHTQDYNADDYYTVFRFKCYDLNDQPFNTDKNGDIIPVDIVIMLRDYYNSDIHVDNQAHLDYNKTTTEYTEEYANGSLEYPFLTLQEAINHTSSSNNIIGVNIRDTTNTKYILDEPLLINQDTRILGNIHYPLTEQGEYTLKDGDIVGYVPRIVNRSNENTFFKVLGNKNINFTLSNLYFIRGVWTSFINISHWNNNSRKLENYENINIHGGIVDMDVTFNDDESYYPYDFIHMSVTLMEHVNNQELSSHMVRVYYDDKIISEGLTDTDGTVDFIININSLSKGNITLGIGNVSTNFFESVISYGINIDRDYSPFNIVNETSVPLIQPNDNIELISNTDYENPVKLYRSDIGLWEENVDLDEFVWENITDGRFIVYVTNNDTINGEVIDEWLLETHYPISRLTTYLNNIPNWDNLIIKDLKFEDDQLTYESMNVSEISKIEDLNGALINVQMEDNELIIDTFYTQDTGEYLSYSHKKILENLIYELSFHEGKLTGERIGEF